MKKLIAAAVTVAVLATLFVTSEPIHGQQQTTGSAAGSATASHKIGLIDMSKVFNEYDKIKAQKESLKAEIQRRNLEAKGMVEEFKKLQAQANSDQFKQDSPQFKQLEQQLITKKSELEAFQQSQQREFLRKESEMYKQVYLETQDMVEQAAKHFGYTLVLRFNGSSIEDADNPQEVAQSMNRQVVFHQSGDDLTHAVLEQLNRRYNKTASN